MGSLQSTGRGQWADEGGEARACVPREPQSLEEAGLHETDVEALLLKILYVHGEL